jgi:hypothetical protein
MVAHGGNIELVDTGPAGTTFRLSLRLVDLAQTPEAEANGARLEQAQH